MRDDPPTIVHDLTAAMAHVAEPLGYKLQSIGMFGGEEGRGWDALFEADPSDVPRFRERFGYGDQNPPCIDLWMHFFMSDAKREQFLRLDVELEGDSLRNWLREAGDPERAQLLAESKDPVVLARVLREVGTAFLTLTGSPLS